MHPNTQEPGFEVGWEEGRDEREADEYEFGGISQLILMLSQLPTGYTTDACWEKEAS